MNKKEEAALEYLKEILDFRELEEVDSEALALLPKVHKEYVESQENYCSNCKALVTYTKYYEEGERGEWGQLETPSGMVFICNECHEEL